MFKGISKLKRCEAIALIDAVALALAEGLDDDDVNALGSIVTTIGDLLMTFASLKNSKSTNSQQ